MVKNEEFYARAQETRNNYKKLSAYLHASIVKEIVGEVFNNGDKFPTELIFAGHHYSKDMVQRVLSDLKLDYKELIQLGDYFIIKDLVSNFTLK